MFNDQYLSGNIQNVDKFASLRLTLVKIVLRYLALGINYTRNVGKTMDEKFLQVSVAFLKYERDIKTTNLVNQIVSVDFSSNFE